MISLTNTCHYCYSPLHSGYCQSCTYAAKCFFCTTPSYQIYQDVPVCFIHLQKSLDTEATITYDCFDFKDYKIGAPQILGPKTLKTLKQTMLEMIANEPLIKAKKENSINKKKKMTGSERCQAQGRRLQKLMELVDSCINSG